MTKKLDGRVALITGAGRGVGRAIAIKLAQEGARLVINDLDAEVAQETAHAIAAMGAQVAVCAGSVTEPDFADRFIASAMDQFGCLDILINNAGYTWDSVIHKMSDEQWSGILDCHLTAPFRILRAAHPVIRSLSQADRQAGRQVVRKVVNISSMAGMFGLAGQVNYASAKAGIVGMTKALAKEWGRLQVTVNAVSFGLIHTRLTAASADDSAVIDIEGRTVRVGVNPDLLKALEAMIPLGRAGLVEEAAGAVYLLCIPESDYISGHNLVCSGGLTGI